MAKNATASKLIHVESHLKETEEHVTRLEKYLNLWVSKQLPRNAMQWRTT
jgi:ferritin-like metal-binding protein YciE